MADERGQPYGDWMLWVCGRDHHIGIEKDTPPWEMGLCPLCEALDDALAAIDALAAAREENGRLREALEKAGAYCARATACGAVMRAALAREDGDPSARQETAPCPSQA